MKSTTILQGYIRKWGLYVLLSALVLAFGSIIFHFTPLFTVDYVTITDSEGLKPAIPTAAPKSEKCSIQELTEKIKSCRSSVKPHFCEKHGKLTANRLFKISAEQPLPDEWVNKTLILFGDANDRWSAGSFCIKMKGKMTWVDLFGRIVVPQERGYDNGGNDPRICVVKRSNGLIVVINIIHFGVEASETFAVDSSKPWLNTNHTHWKKLVSRFKMLPFVLHSAASELYPELCRSASTKCPPPRYDIRWNATEISEILQNSTKKELVKKYNLDKPQIKDDRKDPEPMIDEYILRGTKPLFWFPKPDLILAQSSFWDFKQWMGKPDMNTHEKLVPLTKTWRDHAKQRMFDHVKKQFPDVPVVTRTTPETTQRFPYETFAILNNETRRLQSSFGIRVIDWADKVKNMDALEPDGVHANEPARLAFMEMLLNEMVLWQAAKADCLNPPTKGKPGPSNAAKKPSVPTSQSKPPSPPAANTKQATNAVLDKKCSPQAVEQIVKTCDAGSNSTNTADICAKASSINVSHLNKPIIPQEWVNKTFLFVGDSQDRWTVGSFCNKLKGTLTWVDYFGRVIIPQKRGYDGGGHTPRVCVIRRDNGIILILNVFHYGVGEPESYNDTSNPWMNSTHPHWRTPVNRLKMIPWVLYSAASELYSEWCKWNKITCPRPRYQIRWNETEIAAMLKKSKDPSISWQIKTYGLANLNQSQPADKYNAESYIDAFMADNNKKLPFKFPEPSLILAASSLWDMKAWHNLGLTNETDLLSMVKQWPRNMTTRLIEPLQKVFPNVPLVMRTTPLAIKRFSPVALEALNEEVRNLGKAKGIRVFDWAKKSVGEKYLEEDGFHQNELGRQILIDTVVKDVMLRGLATAKCWRENAKKP
ncbi:hypothetical protein HDU76_006563 [Blyttiomyces sp. JEL0837]|nr:hypothetical protein HDU76_006563 [Blyttiomyces sp. JEL0837]